MVVTTVVYESVFLFVHKSPEYEFDLDKFNLKNQTMNWKTNLSERLQMLYEFCCQGFSDVFMTKAVLRSRADFQTTDALPPLQASCTSTSSIWPCELHYLNPRCSEGSLRRCKKVHCQALTEYVLLDLPFGCFGFGLTYVAHITIIFLIGAHSEKKTHNTFLRH